MAFRRLSSAASVDGAAGSPPQGFFGGASVLPLTSTRIFSNEFESAPSFSLVLATRNARYSAFDASVWQRPYCMAVQFDWMHETARCFGYPSDSTRRGSRLGRLLAGTAGAGPAPCGRVPASSTPLVRLRRPRPVAQLFAASPLAPVAQLHAAMPLAPVAQLWPASPSRAPPTSQGSWVSSRAACRRAGSPARIATVVLAGVQWGGLGLAPQVVVRRLHCASRGPGDGRSRPSHVRG
jgi:hypothetical protein